MKNTYTRTMFITEEELPKMKVRLYVTEGLKWEDSNETEVVYTGLVKWSIVNGVDAAEIEKDLAENEIDEHHEYLILEFNDGTTATFRNSHVDMFLR